MKNFTQTLIIFSAVYLFYSCNKTYDNPPVNEVPIGNVISIGDLKDEYPGNAITIDSNYTIFGNITSEETNGNFYKEVFIQDISGAIKLKLKASGGLYIGDSVRINVQGLTMSDYGELIQLDNVDVDQQVVKIATEKFITPYEATISQLSLSEDQSRLVKLNNVEFSELGMTYADAVNLSTGSRTLSDCNGNIMSVRTSGYANFADDTLPSGNGSITGIFTIYNSEKQFVIRDINEVTMDSSRCNAGGGGSGGGGDYLYKDFDDGSLTSGGWKTFWSGTNPNIGEWEMLFGTIAKASNYSNSTNYACESWLVSPNFDLSSATNPYLIFDNVTRYNGAQLELYISSNYDGVSNPDIQGTWFNLTSYVPNWDTDNFDWDLVSSGNTDLTGFISPSVAIAYKYIGSNSDGATWEVDNIIVTE
ncbi:MAG: DUF5689 domain-containing protein [Flavobacteriales bacterium]|nr:DUF5689 domain-containing protein [Flavobacteriales bacterium]MDG1440131.1 DUF5689 domain-containing protein [Flavobacteriales bacterium]